MGVVTFGGPSLKIDDHPQGSSQPETIGVGQGTDASTAKSPKKRRPGAAARGGASIGGWVIYGHFTCADPWEVFKHVWIFWDLRHF